MARRSPPRDTARALAPVVLPLVTKVALPIFIETLRRRRPFDSAAYFKDASESLKKGFQKAKPDLADVGEKAAERGAKLYEEARKQGEELVELLAEKGSKLADEWLDGVRPRRRRRRIRWGRGAGSGLTPDPERPAHRLAAARAERREAPVVRADAADRCPGADLRGAVELRNADSDEGVSVDADGRVAADLRVPNHQNRRARAVNVDADVVRAAGGDQHGVADRHACRVDERPAPIEARPRSGRETTGEEVATRAAENTSQSRVIGPPPTMRGKTAGLSPRWRGGEARDGGPSPGPVSCT
jgi:hypothetical protein